MYIYIYFTRLFLKSRQTKNLQLHKTSKGLTDLNSLFPSFNFFGCNGLHNCNTKYNIFGCDKTQNISSLRAAKINK